MSGTKPSRDDAETVRSDPDRPANPPTRDVLPDGRYPASPDLFMHFRPG